MVTKVILPSRRGRSKSRLPVGGAFKNIHEGLQRGGGKYVEDERLAQRGKERS